MTSATPPRKRSGLGLLPDALLKRALLRKVPLFEKLDEQAVKTIAKMVEERRFEAGEELVRRDDFGPGLFIVRSGSVEVLGARDGRVIRLREAGPGDFVGETTLFDAVAQPTSLRAVEPTNFLLLSRPVFADLLRAYPQVAVAMLPVLVARIRDLEEALTPGA